MTTYLITTWFGTFLCDEKSVQKEMLFPKREKELLARLQAIKNNQVLEEEKELVKNTIVVVNERRLNTLGTFADDPFFTTMTINPKDYGYPQELFHSVAMTLAQQQVDELLKSEDLQIIQMVNALDDLVQTANLLSERLSSWALIPTPKKKVKPFEKILEAVNKEMRRLENQIEIDMNTIAPNTSAIIGPLIGARLISLAGGMQRMAMLPASTIQILGAEKALFRFKKEGGRPPKHGIIFQHPLVNRAVRAERGRISRLLAAKISTAVKADVFTKRDVTKELLQDLEMRLKEIRKK
jgi:nucleolar protein 56